MRDGPDCTSSGGSKRGHCPALDGMPEGAEPSRILYLLITCRTSTPPQNCHLTILISDGEHQVDDVMGELTL